MGRKKEPDNTVRQILDVSQKLFLEKGYEQTTMQDIVEHLDGLSRGAVYHHFKSKEEIIMAVSKQLFATLYDYDDSCESGSTAMERFRKRLLHTCNYHVSSKILLATDSLLNNPKYLAIQLRLSMDEVMPGIKALIEEGNADGSMKVSSVEATAELLSFLMNSWCIPAVYPGTKDQIIERYKVLGQMGEALGIPFMNDELMAAYSEYAEKYTV